MEKSTLILGIGNLLMGDEGLGVHFANRLAAKSLPEGVDVLDGGTGGFHLLEYLTSHEHIIMVDATMDGHPVGTIRKIKPRFASDFPRAMSTHDIGLKDLVSALQLLGKMPEIDLYVVSIESLQQQFVGLSPEIEEAVNKLADEIMDQLHAVAIW
ncbi:MAG: hydrogenase maturation protease [Saprospiraceae bacterium]|nr:hydrogenase maturation protease [Saprospiraceae bacterium]